METPWRKYYQAKCQYRFAFKTCHIKCYAGCNYFTFKRIGEFFFKNSEARGKNTLHLIDDTTKKSGTKTFDAKSVMITNAVQGDPRKRLGEEIDDKTKKSHSLGFVENLSHKGAECAE